MATRIQTKFGQWRQKIAAGLCGLSPLVKTVLSVSSIISTALQGAIASRVHVTGT